MQTLYQVRIYPAVPDSHIRAPGQVVGIWKDGTNFVREARFFGQSDFPVVLLRLVGEEGLRFVGSLPVIEAQDPRYPSFWVVAEPSEKPAKRRDSDGPSPYDLSDPRHPARLVG